jgi:hypothetical protein
VATAATNNKEYTNNMNDTNGHWCDDPDFADSVNCFYLCSEDWCSEPDCVKKEPPKYDEDYSI